MLFEKEKPKLNTQVAANEKIALYNTLTYVRFKL